MTKRILLVLDDEKYFQLNHFKAMLENVNKKEVSWEGFLCDWVCSLFKQWIIEQNISPAVQKAMEQVKPEKKELFMKVVMACIEEKLSMFKYGYA